MAQGSASEVETELIIAFRLRYIAEGDHRNLMSALDEIGRMITGLANHLKAKLRQ